MEPANKKQRCAAALSHPCSRTEASPQLPPEIWARVLGFSLYSDVARMARVSTSMLRQVMPLLTSLYFENHEGITPEQVRRFDNGRIQAIVLDCLLCNFRGTTSPGKEEFDMVDSVDLEKLVEGLACFQNSLEHVLIGKGDRESTKEILDRLWLEGSSKAGYHTRSRRKDFAGTVLCSEFSPGDVSNEKIYKTLLLSLADAYHRGLLSQNLIIHGLPAMHTGDCYPCEVCDAVCRSFPISQVAILKKTGSPHLEPYFPYQLGTTPECRKLELIAEREGGVKYLQSIQTRIIHDLLGKAILKPSCGCSKHLIIAFLDTRSIRNTVRVLQEKGCFDIRSVPSDEVTRVLYKMKPNLPISDNVFDPTERRRIVESSFRELAAMGFSMEESDFTIVPDKECLVAVLFFGDSESG